VWKIFAPGKIFPRYRAERGSPPRSKQCQNLTRSLCVAKHTAWPVLPRTVLVFHQFRMMRWRTIGHSRWVDVRAPRGWWASFGCLVQFQGSKISRGRIVQWLTGQPFQCFTQQDEANIGRIPRAYGIGRHCTRNACCNSSSFLPAVWNSFKYAGRPEEWASSIRRVTFRRGCPSLAKFGRTSHRLFYNRNSPIVKDHACGSRGHYLWSRKQGHKLWCVLTGLEQRP